MDINEICNSIRTELDKLSDEERLEIFHNYCVFCGRKDPLCQCWNNV